MEDIRIIQHGAMFEVIQGSKTSEELYFEEALGLIASLMMPEKRPCLNWMQTKEEHNRRRVLLEKSSEEISRSINENEKVEV